METVNVKLPSELLRVANLEERNLSEEAARLLALELYREDKVSLGRAAEAAVFDRPSECFSGVGHAQRLHG